MTDLSAADIRGYLTTAYSDEEITILCSDYFRDVYNDFATGMLKKQKIQLLVDHCQRRGLIPNLLAALEKDRPEQYQRQFGSIAVDRGPALVPRERDPKRVFISHAHEDADFAHRLAVDLRSHGWRPWIAPDSILPGEKWTAAINRALEECGVFVLVLTPAAVHSDWVITETSSAIELQHQRKMRFIPLEVAHCQVPPLWDVYQRLPFAGRYEDGLAALLALMGTGPTSRVPLITRPRSLWLAIGGLIGLVAVIVAVLMVTPKPTPPPGETDVPVVTMTPPVDMVWVPGGEFTMGSDGDPFASANEKPQHRVYVEGFWISRTEVTNAQYARCVKAATCTAPNNQDYNRPEFANRPVADVSWHDADAYARWAGGRLPTEAEWEKACRRTDARIYPWGGETPTDKLLKYNDPGGGTTTDVGSYPQGASPYGLLDMAGNVWEWTSSELRDYPYQADDGREVPNAAGRVLRGGAFYDVAANVRCAVRIADSFGNPYKGFGFRVVTSPTNAPSPTSSATKSATP
jgi:formylglycine-generating enzyme required for sulfatase activity